MVRLVYHFGIINFYEINMQFITLPLGFTWKLLKAFKTTILITLVIFSLSMNVAQFTGHVLAAALDTVVKSTLGVSSVATKAKAQVGKLKNSAVKAKKLQKKVLAKQKAKLKAKARMRRYAVAIPVLGVGLAGYFEKKDFEEWMLENPDGDITQYSCEGAVHSAEIVDEVVADTLKHINKLPSILRPNAETIEEKLKIPKCDLSTSAL